MYKHLIAFRSEVKKDRIRAEDVSNDPASLEIYKKTKEELL